jgi:ring-opening amidohydrolase-like protein
VPMLDPGDASAILQLIDEGLISPHEIVAVFGKAEGNGCVNDFTRGYATAALSVALAKPLGIPADEVPSRVAMVAAPLHESPAVGGAALNARAEARGSACSRRAAERGTFAPRLRLFEPLPLCRAGLHRS